MSQEITMTYNGLTIGDGTNFYISELDLGDLPIRQADQLASGRDGGFIFNQNYGIRTISFSVNIFSGGADQFFTDVRAVREAFARTNTAKELIINFWDGSERRIDVFPYILPNPIHRSGMSDKSDFRVSLQAPYPFFKGASSDTITETLYLNQSLGFDYPMTYPFDYVAGSTNNTYVFSNDGDVPALIEIVFNGSVISPTLTNTSAGTFVQIDTTLGVDTSVTLEYTSTGRSILDQNSTSYEQYFNGSTAFFFVPLGSNTFTFSASTYDVLASCEITLTKYYLA